MKNQVLVKRYALGLIHALPNEEEFTALSRELGEFLGLLKQRPRLHFLILRPFLPVSRKKTLVESILRETGVAAKLSRFILLLIDKDRIDLLPDIVEALPDIWNQEKGILTIEVSSVVPLSESQKKSLRERLERLESSPVALKFRSDPSLIGGLKLRKGNMVYDVSIQGDLDKLQEHIIEG